MSIKFSSLLNNEDPKSMCEILKIIVFMRNVKDAQDLLTKTEFN